MDPDQTDKVSYLLLQGKKSSVKYTGIYATEENNKLHFQDRN